MTESNKIQEIVTNQISKLYKVKTLKDFIKNPYLIDKKDMIKYLINNISLIDENLKIDYPDNSYMVFFNIFQEINESTKLLQKYITILYNFTKNQEYDILFSCCHFRHSICKYNIRSHDSYEIQYHLIVNLKIDLYKDLYHNQDFRVIDMILDQELFIQNRKDDIDVELNYYEYKKAKSIIYYFSDKKMRNINLLKFFLQKRKNKLDNDILLLSDNRYEVKKLLIEFGADINYIDINQENVLFKIIKGYGNNVNETIKTTKLLIESGININQINSKGKNCLFGVSNYNLAKLLIDSDINKDLVDNKGLNVFYTNLDYDTLEYYIDLNIDYCIDVPLCEQYDLNKIKIINQYYDLNIFRNNYNDSLLHKYRNYSNEDEINIIKYLIKFININNKNNEGNTLMHLICKSYRNAYSNILIFLIENGGDMNLKNNNGNTPFELLFNKYNNITKIQLKMMKKLIINYNIDINNELLFINPDIKILDFLVDIGVDVNYQNNIGETFIHHFIDEYLFIEKIIKNNKYNIDFTIKDYAGNNILHKYIMKVKYINGNFINLLNHINININDLNNNNESILHIYIKKKINDRLYDTIKLLKIYNIDLYIKNNNNNTFIDEIINYIFKNKEEYYKSYRFYDYLKMIRTIINEFNFNNNKKIRNKSKLMLKKLLEGI